ncbi:unnamed protein product [Gongylonema pulchrum]|uniref:Uncharacterized protein n=1 Tax=Gongylonema pulchrum TaxID=637853 RepID=A0A183E860_9BILA|nr:unnamed protein product [Gongylonema pulchrum]
MPATSITMSLQRMLLSAPVNVQVLVIPLLLILLLSLLVASNPDELLGARCHANCLHQLETRATHDCPEVLVQENEAESSSRLITAASENRGYVADLKYPNRTSWVVDPEKKLYRQLLLLNNNKRDNLGDLDAVNDAPSKCLFNNENSV